MNLVHEYNNKYMFFHKITGIAMQVHSKYKPGLVESAYEAAMIYLLELNGHKVERQVPLPLYWDDVIIDKNFRMDLVIDDNIIAELKAVKFVSNEHRQQLMNYMNLTHTPYGMLINFGAKSLYSEWYRRDEDGEIVRVKLM